MYRGKFVDYAAICRLFYSGRIEQDDTITCLAQGTTGLSVAFDLPTQIGYDSDHELAEGEVGKVGVAIDSLKDIETLICRYKIARYHYLDDH